MKGLLKKSSGSLRTRLLTVIVGPLACIALALIVGGAVFVNRLAEQTSDRVLEGSLAAIAETLAIENGEITLDLPPAAFGMLETPERDNVYYSIRHGGRLLTGYTDLTSPDPASLVDDRPMLRDDVFRGNDVRVAAVARRLPRLDEPVIVQVAETMNGRNQLLFRLASILLASGALLVVATAVLIIPAVAWGLRPLQRLRNEIESRTTNRRVDLSPLSLQQAPREIQPFVGAFNGLLQQLEASTASMRRFTADASHQMRTPLAALKTHLALALRLKPAAGDATDHLHEVEAAATRLERLLTQLLSLARAEERGVHLPMSHVDLTALAQGLTAERAPQAIAANIDISFEAPPLEKVMVCAEPLILEEVATNVIDNAIRYNADGGHVFVRVTRRGDAPCLEVEDDGPGLSPEERTEVFRRFSRLKRDSNRAGSGLGLAIVRTLITKIDGRIEMDDRPGGGRGLLVRIVLRPTSAPECQKAEAAAPALPSPIPPNLPLAGTGR